MTYAPPTNTERLSRPAKLRKSSTAGSTTWTTRFSRHSNVALRGEIVRDNLHQLLLGRPHGGRLNFTLATELPFNSSSFPSTPPTSPSSPSTMATSTPNATPSSSPSSGSGACSIASPVALNHWLGFRLRAMLGKHIFKSIGNNVKIYHGVRVSPSATTSPWKTTSSSTTHVLLDDRGEPGHSRKGASISEYAAVFSPRPRSRSKPASSSIAGTEVGPNARVTYRSLVHCPACVSEKIPCSAPRPSLPKTSSRTPSSVAFPAAKNHEQERRPPPRRKRRPPVPAPSSLPTTEPERFEA